MWDGGSTAALQMIELMGLLTIAGERNGRPRRLGKRMPSPTTNSQLVLDIGGFVIFTFEALEAWHQ